MMSVTSSSMKSLILSSKNLSIFTPNLIKTKSLPHPQKTLFSKPLCFYYKPFKNPNYLISQKPIKTHYKRSLIHTEAYSNRDSGEIHVIVGPMFAGKTTTLLHRILSEKTSGSFQGEFLEDHTHLNKTIRDLCFSGRLREAIGLLWCAQFQFYPETYSLVLQESIHRKQYRWGKIIHTHMVVSGFSVNEYLLTKLLIMYAKSGDLPAATFIFHKLPKTNLVSWNAIIAGNVQNGDPAMGLKLYNELRGAGLLPDQYTFASIFRACATLATLEQGKQVHCIFIKSRTGDNIVVNSALMDMYFKCSSPFEGSMVFDRSLEKNVITWTGLISGYGYNGRVKEVLKYYHKMINEGFRPNYVTFLAVLSACSHGGLVEEGRKYFSSMIEEYNIRPIGKHYSAIVDLLGRAGRLEEAYAFVINSPCKEHSVIWGALLGACRTHGNMDMLKFAANKYFELEPENAGKYIVLCNAYAGFGLWENVAEMRGKMKERGMKKEPGYSMIEVQRDFHFFFMGDNCHKRNEEIRNFVKDMLYEGCGLHAC